MKKVAVLKYVMAYTSRHSFASHLLENSDDIHMLQALMGHANVNATIIYTHVLNKGGEGE